MSNVAAHYAPRRQPGEGGQTTKQDDWGNQFVRQRNLWDGIPAKRPWK